MPKNVMVRLKRVQVCLGFRTYTIVLLGNIPIAIEHTQRNEKTSRSISIYGRLGQRILRTWSGDPNA